jgi:hypothetical protein
MTIADQDIAEFCQLGLRLGVLSQDAVRAWADDVIMTRANPPAWALDLSTADLAQAISALNAVPGKPTADVPIQLLVALVRRRWQRGQLSLQQVQNIGWQLSLQDRLPQPAAGGDWGVVLFCEYEEFEQGYRTEAEMWTSVEEKLASYAAFEQDLPGWAEGDASATRPRA